MKSNEEYLIDDFISDTIAGLEKIEDFHLHYNYKNHGNRSIHHSSVNTLTCTKGNRLTEDLPSDGFLEVNISKDKMYVHGNFYPPTNGMNPISLDYVKKVLEDSNVLMGIDWEIIQQAIWKCNTQKTKMLNILVASGIESVPGINPFYEIAENLTEKSSLPDQYSCNIDFKTISPFTLVKKGDVLAMLNHGQTGICGRNVLGKEIPFKIVKNLEMKSGKNTLLENEKIIAHCDGKLEIHRGCLTVTNTLILRSNVDYKTGNINFPGDVVMQGLISDDFSVKAEGSILCMQTLDASDVEVGENLIVKKGIIGKKAGSIKVKGDLMTKFIERCQIEVEGKVCVVSSIMNSKIYSNDRVDLSKRSTIIGGEIYAKNGIVAGKIGTDLGPKTEIHCGVDYIIANKLIWIRDNNLELSIRLEKISTQIHRSSDNSNLIILRDKIRAAIEKMNQSACVLIKKLHPNENVEIVVQGIIYPGTYLEICSVPYEVKNKLQGVRFRLNKKTGRIDVEKLV